MKSALTLLVFLLAPIFIARAETLPIVFQSTETPPYWSAALPHNGFGGRLLGLLSQAAGVEYRIEYLPIKRFRASEESYLVGDPELIAHLKNHAILPLGTYHLAFIYYKPLHPVMNFQGMRALRGYTLGVLRGTVEDRETFVRYGIKVEESDSNESLLRKLKKGRIDFCIMVAGAAHFNIDKEFAAEVSNFEVLRIPGSARPFALMIDTSLPYGLKIAKQYREVLAPTLRSRAYAESLETYFGKNNIPDNYFSELFEFVKSYDGVTVSK